MDPFPGIEVGAEVELNDGLSAVDDATAIRLENKQDLPLWQHLHYFDESSSDESLDHQHEMPSPEKVKNQQETNPVINLKSRVKIDCLDKNVSALTTTEDPQPVFLCLSEVPREEQFVVLNTFNKGLQDQPYQLTPHFEDTGISCIEVIPSIDFGHLPPSYSTEVYTKNISSYEQVPNETFGKYSYFNSKTQFTGSVKPWRKSHKCQQCGRQFGRQYNLENHRCIKMCLGSPQQNIVNMETMNRLEKMCAEAQKELQNLQGHYKKEHVDAMTIALGEGDSSDIQVWSQEVFSDTIRCNHCGLHFGSGCSLDDHVCNENASQNFTVPENTILINLTHSDLANQEQVLARQMECRTPQMSPVKGERTNLIQNLFSPNSEQNPVESTKGCNETTTLYKCLECDRMFDKRCSITNHLRWHAKERYFISSVGNAVIEPSPGVQEPDGTTQNDGSSPFGHRKDSIGPTSPSQTFTCEYCGRIFNKHCAYATHAFWHLKNKDPKANSEVQEASIKAEQVPFTLIREHESNRECTSPIEICACQSCGRVFNKIYDFISHSCEAIEEQEGQERMMEAQVFLVAGEEYLEEGDAEEIMDENNKASDGDLKKESDSCLDDGNVQGYCNLVRQLSLAEQQKAEKPGCDLLPTPTEPNQAKPPEILESIFELVVGTEEVREVLLSTGGHILPKEEYFEKAEEIHKDDIQVKPKLEPMEKQSLPFIFPLAFVTQLLNRPSPPHRCRDCGIRFHQFWRLKRHRFKVISNRRALRKHQCDCGRTPIGPLHFLLHQLQHLRDTPFICAVCSKRLWGYRQLQAHSWVHRLVSQFQCTCGARFTQLPRYLWHSLLNNAKPRPKAQLRHQPGLQAP